MTWHNISILFHPWHPKTSYQLYNTLSSSLFSNPTLIFLFLYWLPTKHSILVSHTYCHLFSNYDPTTSGCFTLHTQQLYPLTLIFPSAHSCFIHPPTYHYRSFKPYIFLLFLDHLFQLISPPKFPNHIS